VYSGAYAITIDAVRSLAGAENLQEIAAADAVHKIEDGELAHVAILITINPSNVGFEGTKTAIMDRLWNSSSGPLTHVCKCDENIAPHPSKLLPEGMQGTYRDLRSVFKRLWHLARFRLDRRILNASEIEKDS